MLMEPGILSCFNNSNPWPCSGFPPIILLYVQIVHMNKVVWLEACPHCVPMDCCFVAFQTPLYIFSPCYMYFYRYCSPRNKLLQKRIQFPRVTRNMRSTRKLGFKVLRFFDGGLYGWIQGDGTREGDVSICTLSLNTSGKYLGNFVLNHWDWLRVSWMKLITVYTIYWKFDESGRYNDLTAG